MYCLLLPLPTKITLRVEHEGERRMSYGKVIDTIDLFGYKCEMEDENILNIRHFHRVKG